jgi:hypothetical protein
MGTSRDCWRRCCWRRWAMLEVWLLDSIVAGEVDDRPLWWCIDDLSPGYLLSMVEVQFNGSFSFRLLE